MRRFAVVSFVALAGCSIHVNMARDGVGADAVADAMDRAWSAHVEAAERKDAAAACELYTDDVVYCVWGSPDVRGRAAVEAMEKASMATTSIDGVQHWSNAVRVDGEVAHEIGCVMGAVASDGAPAKPVKFDYVAVWRRAADGTWRIAHLVGHMAAPTRDVH